MNNQNKSDTYNKLLQLLFPMKNQSAAPSATPTPTALQSGSPLNPSVGNIVKNAAYGGLPVTQLTDRNSPAVQMLTRKPGTLFPQDPGSLYWAYKQDPEQTMRDSAMMLSAGIEGKGVVEAEDAAKQASGFLKEPPLSLRQKIVQKLNGLDRYQLGDEYGEYRPSLEEQDKRIMQRVIGGNDANGVLNNAIKAKDKIWSQIEKKVAPLQFSLEEDIKPFIRQRIQSLADQGLISPEQVEKMTVNETKKIIPTTIDPNPTLSGKDILTMRTRANQLDSAGLNNAGLLKDGASLQQIINHQIAGSYKDILTSADPEIQKLYGQYSSVKRISEMPSSFRNQSLTVAKIPGTQVGFPLSGTMRKGAAMVVNSKPALAAIGSVLGGGALLGAGVASGAFDKGFDALANSKGYTKKTDQYNPEQIDNGEQTINPNNGKYNSSGNFKHGSPINGSISQNSDGMTTIPSSQEELRKDPITGKWNTVNPFDVMGKDGNPIGMSQEDAIKQSNDLEMVYNTAKSRSDTLKTPEADRAAANAKTALDTFNKKAAIGTGLSEGYQKLNLFLDSANQVEKLLGNTPMDFFNLIKQVKDWRMIADPAYKPLIQELVNMEKLSPGSAQAVINSIDPKSAVLAVDQTSKDEINSFHKTLLQYKGNSATKTPTVKTGNTGIEPTYIPPTLPDQPPILKNVNIEQKPWVPWTIPGAGSELPKIPQRFEYR